MTSMKVAGVEVAGESEYKVRLRGGQGVEQSFLFTVAEDLGVPAIGWSLEFEKALEYRLWMARPIYNAILAIHAARKEDFDLVLRSASAATTAEPA